MSSSQASNIFNQIKVVCGHESGHAVDNLVISGIFHIDSDFMTMTTQLDRLYFIIGNLVSSLVIRMSSNKNYSDQEVVSCIHVLKKIPPPPQKKKKDEG